jgi:hypothetical protein
MQLIKLRRSVSYDCTDMCVASGTGDSVRPEIGQSTYPRRTRQYQVYMNYHETKVAV